MASPVLHVTLSKSAIDASIAFLGPFSIDRRRVLGRAFFCILFILLCGPLLLCNSPPPFDPGGAPPTATSHAPITNATPLITPSLPHLSTPHRNDCNEIDDRRVVRGETKQTTTTTKPKRKETPQKQSVVGFVCVLFFCLFVFAFFFCGRSGHVDDKAENLHAIASLRVLLDATKTTTTTNQLQGQPTSNGTTPANQDPAQVTPHTPNIR